MKRENRSKTLKLLRKSPEEFRNSSAAIRDDKEIILSLLKTLYDGKIILEFASKRVRADKEVFSSAYKNPQISSVLRFASDELKSDITIVARDLEDFEYASEELRSNRKLAMQAVRCKGQNLEFVSNALKSDAEIVLAAIKKWPGSFHFAAEELKCDRNFISKAIECGCFSAEHNYSNEKALEKAVNRDNSLFEFLRQRQLLDLDKLAKIACRAGSIELDEDLVLQLIGMDSVEGMRHATTKMLGNRDFMLRAARINGSIFDSRVPHVMSWLEDDEIFLTALVTRPSLFKDASEDRKSDRLKVRQAIESNGRIFDYVWERFLGDRELLLASLTNHRTSTYGTNRALNRDAFWQSLKQIEGFDQEIMLAAVALDDWILKEAPSDMLDDREFMLKAIQVAPRAIKFASTRLKHDRELVFEAVKIDGYWMYLQGMSDEMLKLLDNDVEMWSVALQTRVAPNHLLRVCNRKILTLAIEKGVSVMWINPELKDDKEFMESEIRRNGKSIYYASERLQEDKNLLALAIMNGADPGLPRKLKKDVDLNDLLFQKFQRLSNAPSALLKDRNFALERVRKCGADLEFFPPSLRNDIEVVQSAVMQDGGALKWASDKLKDDKSVAGEALENSTEALRWCSDSVIAALLA